MSHSNQSWVLLPPPSTGKLLRAKPANQRGEKTVLAMRIKGREENCSFRSVLKVCFTLSLRKKRKTWKLKVNAYFQEKCYVIKWQVLITGGGNFVTQEITGKGHCALTKLYLLWITSSHPTPCALLNSGSARPVLGTDAQTCCEDALCAVRSAAPGHAGRPRAGSCGLRSSPLRPGLGYITSPLSWKAMPSSAAFHCSLLELCFARSHAHVFESKHNLVRSKSTALLPRKALFFLYTEQMRAVYLTTVLHNTIKLCVWRCRGMFWVNSLACLDRNQSVKFAAVILKIALISD